MVKEASKCAEEIGIELNLEQPRPIRTEVCKCQVEKLVGVVRNQRWQGSLVRGPEPEQGSLLLVVNTMFELYQCSYMSPRRLVWTLRVELTIDCAARPKGTWLTSCRDAVH